MQWESITLIIRKWHILTCLTSENQWSTSIFHCHCSTSSTIFALISSLVRLDFKNQYSLAKPNSCKSGFSNRQSCPYDESALVRRLKPGNVNQVDLHHPRHVREPMSCEVLHMYKVKHNIYWQNLPTSIGVGLLILHKITFPIQENIGCVINKTQNPTKPKGQHNIYMINSICRPPTTLYRSLLLEN